MGRLPTTSRRCSSAPRDGGPEEMTAGARSDWTLARRLRVTLAGLFVLLLLAGVALTVALRRADDATSDQVDRTVPARLAASQLLTSLVDQETGLRGYALTGDKAFLQPYRQGLLDEKRARAELERLILPGDPARIDLLSVDAAITAWRGQYASLRTDGAERHGHRRHHRVRSAAVRAGASDERRPRCRARRPVGDRTGGGEPRAHCRDSRPRPGGTHLHRLSHRPSTCAEHVGSPAVAAPRRASAGGGPRRAHRPDPADWPSRPARDRRGRRVHAPGACRRAGGGGAAAAWTGATCRRARSIECGPRAVRIRRVPRSSGTPAQGRQLLPAARAAVSRAARRARRRVHRIRRRRREADAAAHQRPADVQPGRSDERGIRRASILPMSPRTHGRRSRTRRGARARRSTSTSVPGPARSTAILHCSGCCSPTCSPTPSSTAARRWRRRCV